MKSFMYMYCQEIKYSRNPFLIHLATFSELLGTFCKLRKPCLSSVSDFQDPGMTVIVHVFQITCTRRQIQISGGSIPSWEIMYVDTC